MRRFGKSQGFTLIELMVTVAITGILAAIAMPQFGEYRERAFDAEAELALRTVATAEEGYFLDYSTYKSCNQSDCHTFLTGVDPIDSRVTLEITSTGSAFTGTSTHASGTGKVFTWN